MSLDLTLISDNNLKLQDFMRNQDLESFYISSFDTFLSEYVPLEDCHRYYLTGFSGSVAEVLAVKGGKTYLFVDGRYHEQADKEIVFKDIEVVKITSISSNRGALLDKVKELGLKSMGIEGDRTSEGFFRSLDSLLTVKSFDQGELGKEAQFGEFNSSLRLEIPKSEADWGGSTKEKLKTILNPGEAFYITALDSISWVSNIRGYQQPFQSTYMAKALAFYDHLYIFVSDAQAFAEVDHGSTSIIEIPDWSLSYGLGKVESIEGIKKLFYDKNAMNHADYFALKALFGEENIVDKQGGIIEFHSIKNQREMELIRDAFEKSDSTIHQTILEIKKTVKARRPFSELDFYNLANENYKNGGAKEQSFNTISGVGASSSIIHFGSPSKDIPVVDGEIMLFDSGAFYEGGFATDTTRTFLSGGIARPWQKEIYTLVLKGMLNAQNAVFPPGTWGSQIDMLARSPILQAGYNYAHGTGHGVGINVHESGFRISPLSNIPLVLGKIGSIEPGIYIPGKGGVRLENIAEIIQHPEYPDMLTFLPLVFIGFEHALIDMDLLNKTEIKWLNTYEEECKKRNRTF